MNTRETAFSIRKLPLVKAKRYLEDVLAHKQAIPFRRFCRGVGRTAQAKNRHSNGSIRHKGKGVVPTVPMEELTVCFSYMSSPCHIELILSEKEEPVKREPESQLATSKKKSQVLRSGASS
ncbi:unnamed protein product [Lupinus luteus]|uniref:60S ribosomal protein L17 n=1 Tax=Lupinus luteus TaxID=3873 RepID=A0AAV1XT91_LUPLU